MTIDGEVMPMSRGKRPSAGNLVYASQTLDAKLLKLEMGLHLSRFPAHTGDVVSLNFQFARAYQLAFRDQFSLLVDAKKGQNVKGLDIKLFSPSAHNLKDRAGVRKAIHGARQWADLCGLSYDTFIRFCFEFSVGQGKAKYIKQPNQLIPKRLTSVLWKKQLGELVKSEGRAQIADYSAANMGRTNIPACFGVIGARIVSSPICVACSSFRNCGVVVERISAHIQKVASSGGKPILLSAQRKAYDSAKRKRNRHKKKLAIQILKLNEPWTM